MTLTGERVRLRPLAAEDVDRALEWINDGEVTRTLLTGRYPMTRAAEQTWIDERSKISSREVVFSMETRAGDYLGGISLFGITPVERYAEVGIVLGKKAEWGKGYGTEAMQLIVGYGFSELNLNLMYLHVFAEHAAAVHVYEKIGFRHEGRLRARVYRNGRFHDLLAMSIHRDEWEKQQQSTP